ncbi:T9SS type A sorting domain-containing protein [candidate division KSB1 bacterium]|nr:T9SS type A sorting domain-containing protein [candidate division KSB1 bacterium]
MKSFRLKIFFGAMILVSIQFCAPSISQPVSNDAEWSCFRRDLFNTGISPLKCTAETLSENWRFPLGGNVEFALMKDVDADSLDEIFMLCAGKIHAYQETGAPMWTSAILGISQIIDIVDIDNDRIIDIVCSSYEPPKIFILSAMTGEIEWQHYFPPPSGTASSDCIKLADLDNSNDGKLELFCWPHCGGATGYAFAFENGIGSGRIIWSAYASVTWGYRPQVMVADMNCDSIPEIVIGTYKHIYAWQGDNGKPIVDFEFSTGGTYGRNYGTIKVTNCDDDPYPEVAVLAHNLNEHLTMLDNKGPTGEHVELAVLWDKWLEYSYPEDHKVLRISPNSVADVDNDGAVEVVASIFNDTGDERWHLMIFDAMSGRVESNLLDYYLYDVLDLDNDNRLEIVLSREKSIFLQKDNLLILRGRNENSYSIIHQNDDIQPVIEMQPRLLPDVNGTSGNDVLFARDVNGDGKPNIYSYDGAHFHCFSFEANQLNEIWQSPVFESASVLLEAGRTTLADFKSPLISSKGGRSYLLDAAGQATSEFSLGNHYAMPVAADLDGDGSIEILIQDAFGMMNVLDVQHATLKSPPEVKWQRLARGKSAKYGQNSSAYADDIDGDGDKEVFLASDNSLLVYDHNGVQLQEYQFNSFPYEWATGNFNHDDTKDLFVGINASAGIHTNIACVYDGNGSKTPVWTKDFGPYSGYVVVYDFTRDGIDDIILREHYDLITLDGRNGKQWGFYPGAFYHTPILMDVDFSGCYEVINSGGYMEVSVNKMYASGQNITQIWEQPTGYLDCYARLHGTGDVDNDRHVEIGVSSTNGIFTCYDAANGNIEWTYNLGTTASDMICMDADNDDRLEFIFGGMDGYLYILNGEADATNRIEAQFKLEAPVGSPIAADLNADGIAEILVTTYDGILHCFSSTATLASQSDSCVPFAFRLAQNYPNPFNSQTQIQFWLQKKEFVSLKIFNLNGQLVRRLVNREYAPGYHQILWDGMEDSKQTASSGIYVYLLTAGEYRASKKMIFIQ